MRFASRSMRGVPVRGLPYLVLTLACLLAWLPSLGPYIRIADDFVFEASFNEGFLGGGISWLRREGVWRLIGVPIIAAALNGPPLFYPLLAVTTHLVTVLCFFRASQLLLGGVTTPLMLALTAAAYPWGHGALLFASAYDMALATALFWGHFLVLARLGTASRQGVAFVISFAITLVACLVREVLTFAFMASGAIMWLPERTSGLAGTVERMSTRWVGWAPVLAATTYIGLFGLLRPVGSWKAPSWNPESILSVTYHQYSNLFVFQPWFDPATRQLLFYGWNTATVVAAAAISVSLGGVLYLFFRSGAQRENGPPPMNHILAYIVLLLLGASLVYAVGGGYSLDSRKKYALIPFLLLAAGWFWRRLARRPPRLRWQTVVLGTLVVGGVATTWLVVGIWRYEASRGAALTDFLVANRITGDVRVGWEPDLYRAWPTMSVLWGYRLDDAWLINVALKYKGGGPIRVAANRAALLLRVGADSTVSVVAPGR